MKLKHNWRFKALEVLEKRVSIEGGFDSYLVQRVFALRKIPLNDFTTEDLRLMIGQGLSLDYLIPLSLEVLNRDLWVEGDMYEGDLLQAVLTAPTDFWVRNKTYWMELNSLIDNNREEIENRKFDTASFDDAIS